MPVINWDNVEFKGDKRFLSNMYPCEIVIDAITYPSSENYYMAMKFKGTDEEKMSQLSKCSPLESKKTAGKWKKFIRKDWDDIKVDVMRKALTAKFTQNADLMALLINTKGLKLEERNDWNDTFWGTYLGEGQNMLGKLLMEIRDKEINSKCQ